MCSFASEVTREAVPTSSQPGQCGLWLREGEICPACGSREGGWVCGGSSEHVASCEEAAVVSGNWTGLGVDRSGALMTDVRRCCVHFDGTFRRQDPGIKAVREHLLAHGKAARHYLARIATWEKSVRVERMPTFEEGMTVVSELCSAASWYFVAAACLQRQQHHESFAQWRERPHASKTWVRRR